MTGCLSRPAVEHVHVHVGTVVSQNATVTIVTPAAVNKKSEKSNETHFLLGFFQTCHLSFELKIFKVQNLVMKRAGLSVLQDHTVISTALMKNSKFLEKIAAQVEFSLCMAMLRSV